MKTNLVYNDAKALMDFLRFYCNEDKDGVSILRLESKEPSVLNELCDLLENLEDTIGEYERGV